MRLRKYAFPIMVGVLLLLVFLGSQFFAPPASPTPTPTATVPASTSTEVIVFTPTPDTPTVGPTASVSATVTLSPTTTLTSTLSPTSTPSPTNQPLSRLGLCIVSDFANSINVRSGPGTIYAPQGDPLLVGTCLFFSARNEESTWLQIAPNQADASLRQYEGGWIYRELLELRPNSPVDLPAVTLTFTSTPSDTPTVTPTFTRTSTATLTPSETPTASPTETETPVETPTP